MKKAMNHKVIEPVPDRPYCQCIDSSNMRHIVACKASNDWYNMYYKNMAIITDKRFEFGNDSINYVINALYLLTWWPQVSIEENNILFEWGDGDGGYLAFIFTEGPDESLYIMNCKGKKGEVLRWQDVKELFDKAMIREQFQNPKDTVAARAINKIVKDFLTVSIKTDEDF